MSRTLSPHPIWVLGVAVVTFGVFTNNLCGQENRFFFNDQSVSVGTDSVQVPFLMDTTESRHALSISVVFDSANLVFVGVDTIGTETANADWSVGQTSQGDGVLIWSFVMGLNAGADGFDPDKTINPGTNLTAAFLNFNLIANEPGDAFIRFEDNHVALPALNRMVFEATGISPLLGSANITITPLPTFIRGDANEDSIIDIVDPLFSLFVLFGDLSAPACQDRLDVDDDGAIMINDPVLLLQHLYASGPDPDPPFPSEGTDPSNDGLTCD
jgi:hypothetical protein